jgi:hypothetical protein
MKVDEDKNVLYTILGNIVYLVAVCSWQYEDYYEREVFVTADKDKAEKWKEKYNKIIDNNVDRITDYYKDEDYDKPPCFWHDELSWDAPSAKITEVELR